MGGQAADSNFSEAGEFDVAFYEAEASRMDASRRQNETNDHNNNSAMDSCATDDVTDQSDFRINPSDAKNKAVAARSKINHKERYRFPGSEMTRELYDRRVDLNNNS